jgi:hypothetical protein
MRAVAVGQTQTVLFRPVPVVLVVVEPEFVLRRALQALTDSVRAVVVLVELAVALAATVWWSSGGSSVRKP